MSVRSVAAIENFHQIGNQYMPGGYGLKIVDVLLEKQLAVRYQIVAVPTLIRLAPAPARMIIGDLSDRQKVLDTLGL